MNKQSFDTNWRFTLNGKSTTVDLPHDYSIIQAREPKARAISSGAYFPCGVATYEKSFPVPKEWQGGAVVLEIEGAYMNAELRVNHQLLMTHPYGYTSFHCDIAPYLQYGKENHISVKVCNDALPNSRWYSGSGLYRHVWLKTGGDIAVAPYGVYAVTKGGTVTVETTFHSKRAEDTDVLLRSIVLDTDGAEAARCETPVTAMPGENRAVQQIPVPDVRLWSLEEPNLYTLRTEIVAGGAVSDREETTFGFRSIAFDPLKGFTLNGVPMKMKGGCVHHDCGLLGAAAFDRAEERKVELLKQSGFNAVRCAHNPPSPAFLDACDRLGMLVMDEAFDCWNEGKMDFDYHLYFRTHWEQDLTSMILRDRNHPSIILWSTGNEIPERDGRSEGYRVAKELADFVRKLDPSRPVTNALCSIWGEEMVTEELRAAPEPDFFAALTREFAAPLDVAGYNYLRERYEKDGTLFPGRMIIGTETYPKEAFDYWDLTERLPYVLGDFVWTAWDYLGESGIGRVRYEGEEPKNKRFPFTDCYPFHQAYCGDIDICGFKRPQSYYRDFVWGHGTAPYIAVYNPKYHGREVEISAWGWPDVVSSWSWPGYEGKPCAIDVYAGGDEVELLCNGRSLGRKPAGKGARYLAHFETVYEPGTLTAISYEQGKETHRSDLHSAGAPSRILLTPDRPTLKAKRGDLCFVTATVLDASGNPAHDARTTLYATVSGAGSLQAAGSSDPRSEEMYTGNTRTVCHGRLMLVVKTSGDAGTITLNVSAEGLPAAVLTITVEG